MPAKVFVGNLNFETTEAEILDLFAQAGEVVEIILPVDHGTGRPKGFAFVVYSDDDEAAEAIEKFDGYELAGRPLRVNEATDRPRRPPPRPQGGNYRPPPRSRPKGSRRKIRGKKRSL